MFTVAIGHHTRELEAFMWNSVKCDRWSDSNAVGDDTWSLLFTGVREYKCKNNVLLNIFGRYLLCMFYSESVDFSVLVMIRILSFCVYVF